jgi:hypothetical protein
MGFFKWHNNSIALSELQSITDEIASKINELTSIEAETRLNITFDQYAEGLKLPATIKNNQYTINITENYIFGNWKGAQVASPLTIAISEISDLTLVHLWESEKTEYTREELREEDKAMGFLLVDSGCDFQVEVKQVQVSGYFEHHTFIYKTDMNS